MSQTDENVEDLPLDEEKTPHNVEDAERDESNVSKKEGQELEEEEVEEEEPIHYNSNDFISGPKISKDGSLPLNILDFHFSFGYSCRKNSNLVNLDGNTLCFASGNFINFFEVPHKKIWFRRSALGGGIGHIRKNPNPEYPHFAVAECGRKPIIILYEWPSLEIVCILKGGAARTYSNLDFSPDGELMVSQSGEPDYLITVWNWHERKILLRNKSYVNDVDTVVFSPYVPGQLTTCGIAHIKFWKMARTFTGLKLKGEVGRFGRTEYSDILGILPMPDEKVVSGCSWGNILVWDGGLITLEIFRSLRRRCHDAPVVQFFYNEGELWSVSMDGHVRVWWYEKIDQADPPDDDRVILIDPSYDFYTTGLMLYRIVKRYPDNSDDSWYFAQDGNGGIWTIDLNTEMDPKQSVLLYKCHAGEVVDIAACPFKPYLASLGRDGRIYLYHYVKKKLIFHHEFPAKGRCMLWLPISVVTFGDVMLAGFDDGMIRVCCMDVESESNISLVVTQVIKPHNKPVTQMSTNTSGDILVTAGEDCTVFVFQILKQGDPPDLLIPIGFIPSPDIVTCITWHISQQNEVLFGCLHGQMMQVEVPSEPQDYTEVSYALKVSPKYKNFTTYKSQIRRDIKIRQIEERKAKKVAKKRKEMEKIKKDNPGLEIDEETFLADSESEEELEPLFIPEVANKILWLQYTKDGTIWMSVAGYDAGYIYEYHIDQKEDIPLRFSIVNDADDIEISSYVYNSTMEYLIFAMQDGSIRLNKVKDDFRNLSDYWQMSMHDNQNGFVPRMTFSYDEKYFFSCGHDGNIFAYTFEPKLYRYPVHVEPHRRITKAIAVADMDDNYTKLSLEETKTKAEEDRVMKVANERRAHVRDSLKRLRDGYTKVLARNANLLESQRLPKEKLELDSRVTEYVNNDFEDQLKLVKRKLAYDLEKSEVQMKKLKNYLTNPCDLHPIMVTGISNPNLYLMSVRQRELGRMFYEMLELIECKILEEDAKGRIPERPLGAAKCVRHKSTKSTALEYFLLSLSPSVIEGRLGPRLNRMLSKYRNRKAKWDKRYEEWDRFICSKPVSGVNHPDDQKLLGDAKNTIGDYKLKEDPDYKAPPEMKQTTLKKYKEVMLARLKEYNLRHNFSKKVYDIRERKYIVRQTLVQMHETLQMIHEELPPELCNSGPSIPDIDASEFPEEKLEPKLELPEEDVEHTREEVKCILEQPDLFENERQILPHNAKFPSKTNNHFVMSLPAETLQKVFEQDLEDLLDSPDNENTPVEICLRVRRLNKLLFLQDQIVNNMETAISDFNASLEEVKKERIGLYTAGDLIDLHILSLNQELNILKMFEDNEDVLTKRVSENMQLVHDLEDKLEVLNSDKEKLETDVEIALVEEAKIQEKFKHATENNKFFNFLKKVFKKKYKPPKQKVGDDSSSESSSSSSSDESDEEDEGSIDSRDFGFIRQDLNVCPKGCEVAIFNFTVNLRSKRHEIEQFVREQNRVLDMANQKMELSMRQLGTLKNQLQASQIELEDFQREKQRLMNQIQCTVVLKWDQITAFDVNEFEINNFLIFSKTELTNLYKRVGILQREDYDQKYTHDVYMKHLVRIKKDLSYMNHKFHNLKLKMKMLMEAKFGKVVDINEIQLAIIKKNFQHSTINELEEVVLKKLVFDVRIKLTDVKRMFYCELNRWIAKGARAQNELIHVIKENTRRLDLLQLISREKKDLTRIVSQQPKKRENIKKIEQAHDASVKAIEKLEAILEEQMKQMQELKAEIKTLKTKGLPPKLKAEEKSGRMTTTVETDVKFSKEWMDLERYVEEEQEEEEKHITQEITLPGYYSNEAEDIIKDLLDGILEDVDKYEPINVITNNILSGVMRCISVSDIIEAIINNLPITPTNEQKNLINSSAEKLYQINELEASEESIIRCAQDLVTEVVERVLANENEPHEMVIEMAEKLVENIPNKYILHADSLEIITGKIDEYFGDKHIDRDKLAKAIVEIPIHYKHQMMEIINVILERVFKM